MREILRLFQAPGPPGRPETLAQKDRQRTGDSLAVQPTKMATMVDETPIKPGRSMSKAPN